MSKTKDSGAGVLFQNPKAEAKRGVTPDWVIAELVARGVSIKTARALPVRAAFGRLYALRRKAFQLSPAGRAAEANRVADILARAVEDESASEHHTQDACLEALSLLPTTELTRVAAGLRNLLREVARDMIV